MKQERLTRKEIDLKDPEQRYLWQTGDEEASRTINVPRENDGASCGTDALHPM